MYGGTRSTSIKNFAPIKTAAIWAGWLGVIQACAWIGLTVTGICAYKCKINVASTLTYGSLLRTVFLDVYWKGDCVPDVYQNYDYSILETVKRVLDPTQILVWDCVYLGVAVCWLVSSALLLSHVTKDDAKKTSGVVLTWVCLTFCISAMDLALGIIFGIDYSRFEYEAYNYNINSINSGVINPNAAQLIAGEISAISMMFISFKGFILWIINVGLSIYLSVLAAHILRDNDSTDTLFMPRKDSDDVLTTRPPIRAYDEIQAQVYTNEAFVPETRSVGKLEVNEEAIVRAAHMSRDASLMENRFRNLDSFQQYPQNTQTQKPLSPPPLQDETVIISGTETLPMPDYSPLPYRSSQNGILRNQRY